VAVVLSVVDWTDSVAILVSTADDCGCDCVCGCGYCGWCVGRTLAADRRAQPFLPARIAAS